MRGIRGAITVEENTAEAVMSATQEVVKAMLEANDIRTEDIGAAIFTATEDITAVFPAKGARALPGFDLVPGRWMWMVPLTTASGYCCW